MPRISVTSQFTIATTNATTLHRSSQTRCGSASRIRKKTSRRGRRRSSATRRRIGCAWTAMGSICPYPFAAVIWTPPLAPRQPQRHPEPAVVGRPEPARCPRRRDLAGHRSLEPPHAAALEDVVDPLVEGTAGLAQVVAVTAGQAELLRVRVQPGVGEAAVEQVRVRGRGRT